MAGPSRLVWLPREGVPEPVLWCPPLSSSGSPTVPGATGWRWAWPAAVVGSMRTSSGRMTSREKRQPTDHQPPPRCSGRRTGSVWSASRWRWVRRASTAAAGTVPTSRSCCNRPTGASGASGVLVCPRAWSGNGASLVFVEGESSGDSDINMLSMDDDRRVTPLIATEFSEASAGVSPDGRWITYVSDRRHRGALH